MSQSPSIFKIPMLGKFLGGAEQNTNGQFIEGDIYVITGYNYGTDCVEAAGLHSNQTHMVDASAFEVVRNEMHTFQHGHLQGLDLLGDMAECELRHDDHLEALSFSPFMHVDLSNSPDYSSTGRYIGNRWPELHEQAPARPLDADQYPKLKDYCLQDVDYSELELRTAAFIHQSPRKETYRERFVRERREHTSAFNHLFATGHVDALRAGMKERRFASLGLGKDVFPEFRPQAEALKMLKAMKEQPTITDDIAEAMLAIHRSMHVPQHLLGERIAHSAEMRSQNFNCRCEMPELKKGLHGGAFILDDPYVAMLEDGKPTYAKPFIATAAVASEKFKETLRR